MATVQSLVPKVAAYLVKTAAERRTATYREVSEAVGTFWRVIPQVLEVIRAECRDRDWPALTVIVVSSETGKPGEAFLDPWLSRDAPQSEKDAMLQKFRHDVFAFDWTPLLARYPLAEKVAPSAQASRIQFDVLLKGDSIEISRPGRLETTLIDDRQGSPHCHRDLYQLLKDALAESQTR